MQAVDGRTNIKITHTKIFSFEFFAPFNFLYFEEKQRLKCLKNQRFQKAAAEKSISGLTDDLMFRLYNVLFSFFQSGRRKNSLEGVYIKVDYSISRQLHTHRSCGHLLRLTRITTLLLKPFFFPQVSSPTLMLKVSGSFSPKKSSVRISRIISN